MDNIYLRGSSHFISNKKIYLGLLASAQILNLGFLLPSTHNHSYIFGFANIGVLIFLVVSKNKDYLNIFKEILAPYLRIIFLIAYAAAAISKLNQGFFDTSTSCAVTMANKALSFLNQFGLSVSPPNPEVLPLLVATSECLVPILLSISKLRNFGVVFTIAFHIVISFSPTSIGNVFTVALFPFLILFLPISSGEYFRKLITIYKINKEKLAFMVLWLVALFGGNGLDYFNYPNHRNYFVIMPVMFFLGIFLIFISVKSRFEKIELVSFNKNHVLFVFPVFLIFLNAASPYLGIKSISSFTMYSNLDTSNNLSNHFVIPRFSLLKNLPMDDVVLIKNSSNDYLQSLSNQNAQLTFHELKKLVNSDPGMKISFIRNGKNYEYTHAYDSPLFQSKNWLADKLIAHRPIYKGSSPCLW